MQFRLILLGAGALLSTASFASYELLLTTDYNNNRVNRYDPQTGTFLGSFGQGYMNGPAKIALDESKGLAYITNYPSATIQVWNYSTGVYENEFASGGPCWGITRLSNGNIVAANGSNVNTFSPTGTLLSTFSALGFSCDTDGTYLYIADAGVIRKYTTGGTLVGSLTFSSARAPYDIKFRSGVGYAAGFGYKGIFATFNSNTMTGYAEKTITGFTTAMDVEGIALGHGAAVYLSGQSSASGTPTVVTRYNSLSQGFGGTFASQTSGTRISGMAIVVAPEPGTWAALGLGAVILLRRRRSS